MASIQSDFLALILISHLYVVQSLIHLGLAFFTTKLILGFGQLQIFLGIILIPPHGVNQYNLQFLGLTLFTAKLFFLEGTACISVLSLIEQCVDTMVARVKHNNIVGGTCTYLRSITKGTWCIHSYIVQHSGTLHVILEKILLVLSETNMVTNYITDKIKTHNITYVLFSSEELFTV